MRKHWLFYLVLMITFLFGGSLQLLGIISNTLLTILVSVSIVIHAIFQLFFRHRLMHLHYLSFLSLALTIVASAILNSTNATLTILYFWLFCAIPFLTYYFSKHQVRHLDTNALIRFLLFVAVIQLPVMILQRTFYKSIVALGSRNIGEVDVSYGTFFLANDHALCFLVLSLFTFLLFSRTKTPFLNRHIYIFWLALTIILSNSKISVILLVIIFSIFMAFRTNVKTLSAVGVLAVIMLFTMTALPSLYDYVEEKIVYINQKVTGSQTDEYNLSKAIEAGNAERTQILYYYLNRPIKVLGNGPYDYYDPIEKKFSLFPNFSQVLWFYNDLGVLSLIMMLSIYAFTFFYTTRKIDHRLIYLLMIIVYSYFANTLSDLAFNLIYFVFIFIESQNSQPKLKASTNELSMHTIS